MPKIVVPKVRVELTRGCPHRFLSCIGVVPASPSVSGMVLSGLGIYIWGGSSSPLVLPDSKEFVTIS